ncbi:MAG: anti-sigma factor [Phycisphaerales bacterium]|nr:anti-sigma factor [Phycisphaerales bacterium]
MSETRYPDFSDRLLELGLDQALMESTESEQHELRTLDPNGEAQLQIEMLLAELDIAGAEADPISPPAGLIESVQSRFADAPPELRLAGGASARTEPAMTPRPMSWLPWTVAAAALLMAFTVLLMPRSVPASVSPAQQRAAFLEQTPPDQRIQWDWIVTEDPANASGVTGDIVWSDKSNRGYMRISGLEANNPSERQYQLWIFDATRPEGELPQFGEGLLSQRPIDGGVFDIDENGEVIIPIDAKLNVRQAAAFAVTIEPSGGVVVSDRSRVPLLALAP